jgi:hypothetical protein
MYQTSTSAHHKRHGEIDGIWSAAKDGVPIQMLQDYALSHDTLNLYSLWLWGLPITQLDFHPEMCHAAPLMWRGKLWF